VRFWVGVTDHEWYRYLAGRKPDEVNFWQPSAGRMPVRLTPGAPFLFKLHASHGGRIVGGGFFAHYSVFPVRMAWEAFEDKNGAPTLPDMITRIARYRRRSVDADTHQIGCFVLLQPFFFPEPDWIAAPTEWAPNIVQGRSYDSETGAGRELWDRVRMAIERPIWDGTQAGQVAEALGRYGAAVLVRPRLGQGAFRFVVTDAYDRRCAITGERTLPALEAAHVKPFSQSGPHDVGNGVLLRRDLHALFDRGYLTVTPELRVRVSPRIRTEFENGRDYYALESRTLRVPGRGYSQLQREYLEWHGDMVFRS
jgi:putative restriction endonuclease